VFVRTQQRVERLVAQLKRDGFHAAGIHNAKTVAQRRHTVELFREYVEEVEKSPEKMVLLPKRKVVEVEREEENENRGEGEEEELQSDGM
jgi:hypothetical protein